MVVRRRVAISQDKDLLVGFLLHVLVVRRYLVVYVSLPVLGCEAGRPPKDRRWKGGYLDGWMNGWIDGWMNAARWLSQSFKRQLPLSKTNLWRF